jgi:type I restriction enzyme S subunit
MASDGWHTSLLDHVTRRGSGHTPNKEYSEYWNGGIKWVSLADSSKLDNGYILETDKEISEQGLKNSSAVLHPKGTVILSRDAGVGKSAMLGDEMAVSQHFIAWRCDQSGELHNRFLYYWLQYKKKLFERMAFGSTIKTIGLPFFKKLTIQHPDYDDQKKIADILSTWDKAIETTGKLLANAEAQKRALMQQLLSGKRRKTRRLKAWKRKTIGELFHVQLGKMLNKAAKTPIEQFPYLTNINVRWGSVETQELNSMYFSAEERHKFRLLKGDLLVCEGGEVGRCAIWNNQIEECYYQKALHRLRPLDHQIDPRYIYYFFENGATQGLFRDYSSRSSIAHLTREKLLQVPVLVPPSDEQRTIVDILTHCDEKIHAVKGLVENTKKQKRALMQQLLTGKKRVKL